MKKSVSIAMFCVIVAIALVLAVFAVLPAELAYGEYGIYNSPINLFQGDSMFSDSIVATYEVEGDAADMAANIAIIRQRLGSMYGRYFASVKEKDGAIVITLPKTVNSENVSENTILNNVTVTGKMEILADSSYSEDKVVLTNEHFGRMRIRRYANGATTYYILNIRLTDEGAELAKAGLNVTTSTLNNYAAIDGTVSYALAYSDGMLQIYTSSEAECQRVKGLAKSGALSATLTQSDTEKVESYGGMIFAIVCTAIVLAAWIFLIVRYKGYAIAPIVSQLVAIVVFWWFAGAVYFNYLNIASAIGIILGYGMMVCFEVLVLEKMRKYSEEKTYASARYRAFVENNKWNAIVHGIVLVVGVALWLIPTGVTAPLGNALVYWAVLSFGVTMGLDRAFSAMASSLVAGNPAPARK